MNLAEDYSSWYNLLVGIPIILLLCSFQVRLFQKVDKDFNPKVYQLTDYCNLSEIKDE
jgi:hypothetical protein